jgi:carbon storage regulator
MLVLSRRESERIQLGDSIVLTIVRVNGDRVRVGIEAPAHIKVRRGELLKFPDVPDAPSVELPLARTGTDG